MSQHPSLRTKGKGTRFRSVLKRFEKLRHLIEKEKWDKEMSIFGLPKIKMLKFKIKKEKAAPEEVSAEAGVEATAEGAIPAAEGKQPKVPTGSGPASGAKKEAKKETKKKG